MTTLVFYILLFAAIPTGFIFVHLLAGKLVRPIKPDPSKLTIYECGEPTIGSAWVQFDLRYYVIALLFVIFDVEVAFFFPWALVFGQANTMAKPTAADSVRLERAQQELWRGDRAPTADTAAGVTNDERQAAHQLAWIAFWDILIFFGVLLVGFAYLWKRGDVDWVRTIPAEPAAAASPGVETRSPALVGADQW